MKKLVLIDGNSILYRAFFALPLLTNKKGQYTNAVYGFTNMLLKIIEEEEPTHMLVAFDKGKETFRHKQYSEYKGRRQKTPDELSEQFPLVRDVLDTFQIPRYEVEEYEADDIIGTVATEAAEKNWDVKIFTGDKDLLQLVSERVTVALTIRGISTVENYDEALIYEKYGMKPKQLIDMKGLMGDNSDNIPGVPGIGEITAKRLIKQFGSMEKVLQSIDEISGKRMKERLIEHKDDAIMSKELATIFVEVPYEKPLEELQFQSYNKEKVIELFTKLDFSSLLSRFAGEGSAERKLATIDYTVIEEVKNEHIHSPAALIVEVLADNYHEGSIEGIAIVHERGRYFVSAENAFQSEAFVQWAKNEDDKKWVFDAKRAVVALGWEGVTLNGVDFDVQMASYLLDPSLPSNEIYDIAMRHNVNQVEKNETVYGKGAKMATPEQSVLAEHLVRKADALFQLKPIYENALKENEQAELYRKLEMPLSVILGRMELTGVHVDKTQLEQMGNELEKKLQDVESTIHTLAGETFNVNSPKQLGEILFEKLGLPPIKKTKTGYSTAADVLEKLVDKHEIINHILTYRQVGKLYSTYVEGLLKVIHKDTNKIHTRFNQALTQTGRLSSTDPNLQNIPVRLEEGRKIRKAFVPSEQNWHIVTADYSQIELRVLAHISEDENLKNAFKDGMDIHTKTAMDVFHVSEDEVTANMRRSAKAVNFGIVYGISDYGLSQNLGITRKEASLFIERYFESFPNVKTYMEEIVAQAKEQGYVTTLLHRRRYLPDLKSRNFNRRSFAERTAMNTPIQGTAADIIKKAMIEIAMALEENNMQTRMLLQVHDELIFEVPDDELTTVKQLVPKVMEQAMELAVPLKVDIAHGPSWYDAE